MAIALSVIVRQVACHCVAAALHCGCKGYPLHCNCMCRSALRCHRATIALQLPCRRTELHCRCSAINGNALLGIALSSQRITAVLLLQVHFVESAAARPSHYIAIELRSLPLQQHGVAPVAWMCCNCCRIALYCNHVARERALHNRAQCGALHRTAPPLQCNHVARAVQCECIAIACAARCNCRCVALRRQLSLPSCAEHGNPIPIACLFLLFTMQCNVVPVSCTPLTMAVHCPAWRLRCCSRTRECRAVRLVVMAVALH